MNIFDAIRKRRSIRSYQDKAVTDELLTKILEAGRQAPSASNRQEWRFVVVRNKKIREALCKAAKNQPFVKEAPVIIACCAKTDNHVMTCGQPCYPIDVAAAIDHMTLAAVELGLGTCWIGAFHEDEVKNILSVPDDIRVVELLALGYPVSESTSFKERLPLEDIVFFEKWGSSYHSK
ncbi:MAG: nitroreductase family protein [Candidatus Omnitrophota bacterium]|nr:MAG: nitroreductase family protein [Candidatus Omnitrophota bacterium]